MKLTAVILAKNEEDKIIACLKSLKFVSEILLIDNGSTDRTAQLAKKAKAKIIESKADDFSFLRNLAKKRAAGEWLLYVDADERVTERLAGEIKKAVNNKTYNAYYLTRINYFYGVNFEKQEKMIRLIKKEALLSWQGCLHETAAVRGNIGILSQPLLHFAHNDLSRMVEKTNAWSEIEAQLRFKNNHPAVSWWRFLRVMLTAFYTAYFRDKGYRLGTLGLIEAVYQSFSIFVTYAKLWQKQNA